LNQIFRLEHKLTSLKSFLSLSLMRVIQGFSAAPLETLVSATVSEIFFVYEKGKMLSIWNLFIMSGVKLALSHLLELY
jgi:MFS family permease